MPSLKELFGCGQETYLGDGVYAAFDGYQIWLRAPRESGDHVIALEPPVFAGLVRYRDSIIAAEKVADEGED